MPRRAGDLSAPRVQLPRGEDAPRRARERVRQLGEAIGNASVSRTSHRSNVEREARVKSDDGESPQGTTCTTRTGSYGKQSHRGQSTELVIFRDERRRAEHLGEVQRVVQRRDERVVRRNPGVQRPGERAEDPRGHERRAAGDVRVQKGESIFDRAVGLLRGASNDDARRSTTPTADAGTRKDATRAREEERRGRHPPRRQTPLDARTRCVDRRLRLSWSS